MEACRVFKEMHPEVEIQKSSFSALRPENVLLSSNMPHNVCMCKYHAWKHHTVCVHPFHFTREMGFYRLLPPMSDTSSEECMRNSCLVCKDGNIFNGIMKDRANLGEPMNWLRWFQ